MWQAARHGLSGQLIDFEAEKTRPASEVVVNLLNKVRPALEQNDDWEEISELVSRIIREGNAAQRQRQVYKSTGSYQAVVDSLIRETAGAAT